MANTNPIVRKSLLDMNNPLMIRELNRQMDWIWKKLLGGIQEKDLDPSTTVKIVERTEEIISEKIKTGTVETDELVASLAALMVAQIGVASIDFQQVVDLTGNQAIFKRVMANKVMIDKLVVTEANILSVTLGNLILKSNEDGVEKYYSISVSSDGTIETKEVVLSEADIANGSYRGKEIVKDTEDMNIADLNATNIASQSAMIGSILTTALKAGKITAAEALLASAVIPDLYVTSLTAIGNTISMKANDAIMLMLGGAMETSQWFSFTKDRGLVIRQPQIVDEAGEEVQPQSSFYTQTDHKGYHVRRDDLESDVFSAIDEGVMANSFKMGDMTCYAADDGGWVWVHT